MSDHMTEPYDTYEPEPSYDWDYRRDERGPKILWGRIAILGGLVVLAFLLGRASAPSGIAPDQVERLRGQLRDAQTEIQALEDQLAETFAQPTPGASPTEESTGETGSDSEAEIYVVKRNDTLLAIANDVYGDPDLDECIAAANNITDPTQLSVGQELIIPDESTCG